MEIRNFGICGATTDEILEKELPAVREFHPTLAILLAGTNDTCNAPAIRETEIIRKNYRALLGALTETGAKVIALTIPPVVERALFLRQGPEEYRGMFPLERIARANAVEIDEAQKAGAEIVDLHRDFLLTYDLDAEDSGLLNGKNFAEDDGCHPTAEGCREMAWLIAQKIEAKNLDFSRVACVGDSITFGAYMTGAGTADGNTYPAFLQRFLTSLETPARSAENDFDSAAVYQLFLRAFTPEGTLAAAKKRLPEIAATGVKIVYLCPVATADRNEDRAGWSPRQTASGCGNARNPYRIADFNATDPEYGTDADLCAFIAAAHQNHLKVLLDLVYYHCGPAFADAHPDWVVRGADGKIANGQWRFPELEFKNPALRAYLLDNMRHCLADFDADGFRCDVGDRVPLDFWEDARRRLDAVKPGFLLLCEGEDRAAAEQKKAFDCNYSFSWSTAMQLVFRGIAPARRLARDWRLNHSSGARFLRAFENHDIVNDSYDNRIEKAFGPAAADAMLALNFTLDGVPFLYNGIEFGDTARHSIFANPGEMTIDRTHENAARLPLIQTLCRLKRERVSLRSGETFWLSPGGADDSIAAFRRTAPDETATVFINTTPRIQCFTARHIAEAATAPELAHGWHFEDGEATLEAFGFAIIFSSDEREKA